jgi:excinuclease UvrABC nuclease subunit
MENYSFCGRNTKYKSGIYFLYNNKNEVIYVGKVGNGEYTSLYDRMVGHGSGSHNKKMV